MATVDVVFMLPVGGLGPKVDSHLALLYIHHVNWVNSRDNSTINIVLAVIIIFYPQ